MSVEEVPLQCASLVMNCGNMGDFRCCKDKPRTSRYQGQALGSSQRFGLTA